MRYGSEPDAQRSEEGAEGAEGGKEKGGSVGDAREVTGAVIGAAIEVHRVLGPGLFESIYEGALAIELKLRGIPFERQVAVQVDYKGHPIGHARLDLLVACCLVVELKSVEHLAPIHTAQVLSYLRATNLRHGLLLTFNVLALRLGIKRVIQTQPSNSAPPSAPSAPSSDLRESLLFPSPPLTPAAAAPSA
jgi:GxxExxY protein